MAIIAIEKAGKDDHAAVRDTLAALSFESTRGPFKFDEKGDPLLGTHVVKIEGWQGDQPTQHPGPELGLAAVRIQIPDGRTVVQRV